MKGASDSWYRLGHRFVSARGGRRPHRRRGRRGGDGAQRAVHTAEALHRGLLRL